MGDAPLPTRPSRSRFWLWTAFLAFCGALGLGKPVYDLHWENRQALYAQAMVRELRERQAVGTEIWQRLYGLDGESPENIEAVLGLPDGELATIRRGGGPEDVQQVVLAGSRLGPYRGRTTLEIGRLAYPFVPRPRPFVNGSPTFLGAGAWRIELRFRDGGFAGATATPPPPPAPPGRAVRVALDQFTLWALVASPFVWLGGLLAGAVERRRRGSRFAEVAMAAALAGTVAWAVSWGRYPAVAAPAAGLLVGAAGMLVASRVRGWLRRLEQSRSLHFCYTCGYDLRGNESGVCPECGSATFAGQQRRRAALAAAEAASVAMTVDDDEDVLDESDEVDDDAEGESEPAGATPGGLTAGVPSR